MKLCIRLSCFKHMTKFDELTLHTEELQRYENLIRARDDTAHGTTVNFSLREFEET